MDLGEHHHEWRLARLRDWCGQGQSAAAELELHAWRREEDCPDAARLMLAGLLSQRGRHDAALEVLAESAQIDPELMKLRIALLTELGRVDEARLQTERLYHEWGHDSDVLAWLHLMQTPGADSLPVVTESMVELLAGELVGQVELLPTLVTAQKIRPDLRGVRLLRDAVQRILPDMEEMHEVVVGCWALAELSLLLGDQDDARRWAHRGLRMHPHYAPLALVLAQLADDTAIGPPASKVLEETARVHPSYRDVLAALIRRQHAEGQHEAARMRLDKWVQREAEHPVVRALQRELAA